MADSMRTLGLVVSPWCRVIRANRMIPRALADDLRCAHWAASGQGCAALEGTDLGEELMGCMCPHMCRRSSAELEAAKRARGASSSGGVQDEL